MFLAAVSIAVPRFRTEGEGTASIAHPARLRGCDPPEQGLDHAVRPLPPIRYRSVAMILSMLRSASAVMVTKGLTLVLPGISEPSMT